MARNYTLLTSKPVEPGPQKLGPVSGGGRSEIADGRSLAFRIRPECGPVSAGKVPTHGSIRHSSQSRSPLEKNNPLDAHASRDLVLLWLRHPHVCGAA